jgi:hypothetical protein
LNHTWYPGKSAAPADRSWHDGWVVVVSDQGVNGLDFGRRDVGKRAEDRIADLVKKAMQPKISADSNRADFVLAA